VPRASQPERVATSGEGADELASGDDNLVWRALVAFCGWSDLPVPDVGLWADNRVPLERGLGSSSAAIVAGLVLGRALTAAAVGDRDLVRLATELEGHPDNVAAALLGGLVVCATDPAGELVVRRVNPAPSLRPVVLVPTVRQATSGARAVLPETLSRADAAQQAARAGHVLDVQVTRRAEGPGGHPLNHRLEVRRPVRPSQICYLVRVKLPTTDHVVNGLTELLLDTLTQHRLYRGRTKPINRL
jgi:homoserine kinase